MIITKTKDINELNLELDFGSLYFNTKLRFQNY